jgi:hypothetical protein
MSLLRSFGFWAAANYKHHAPTELKTVSDDNPRELDV